VRILREQNPSCMLVTKTADSEATAIQMRELAGFFEEVQTTIRCARHGGKEGDISVLIKVNTR